MKKIICTIFITILTILPKSAQASGFDDNFTGDFFHIMVNGTYDDTSPLEIAPKQNDNDYYWYDDDFDEIILVNNNLEDDQNSDRDFLLKNQANLSKYDKMDLDFLNALADGKKQEIISVLITNVEKLSSEIKNQENNCENLINLQKYFARHLYAQIYGEN